MVEVEEPVQAHIEPIREVLSIELFPGKMGFVKKIGGHGARNGGADDAPFFKAINRKYSGRLRSGIKSIIEYVD